MFSSDVEELRKLLETNTSVEVFVMDQGKRWTAAFIWRITNDAIEPGKRYWMELAYPHYNPRPKVIKKYSIEDCITTMTCNINIITKIEAMPGGII